MAKLQRPPLSNTISTAFALVSSEWGRWFFDTFNKVNTLSDRADMCYYEVTITADDLDSGRTPVLVEAEFTTDSWKVRDIFLSGDGADFGAGGDKALAIQDASSSAVYTLIPSATLKSLATSRWGDTGAPYPVVADDLTKATQPGQNIEAVYSGGATGYGFAGSLKLVLLLERVA